MEIKNFDKKRAKFILEINQGGFGFNIKLIPSASVQNIDKELKVSHLLVTSLENLAANT